MALSLAVAIALQDLPPKNLKEPGVETPGVTIIQSACERLFKTNFYNIIF